MVHKTKISSMTFEKKVAIYILVCGLIMMFLIPTWQTPDEYTHLTIIGSSIGNENFASLIGDSVDITRNYIEFHYERKVDFSELKTALSEKPDYKTADLMPNEIKLSFIKHLPSTLGIFFGVLIGVPTFWALILGELFSLIFYTFVCYFALKKLPVKKELFALIMLIPMCLQQAGSIGYDVMSLPISFYFIAYVLYAKYEDEVGIKDFCIMIGLLLVIVYMKMPYVFLGLFMFVIPLDNICLKFGKFIVDGKLIRKVRVPVCVIIGAVGLMGIYLLRDNWYVEMVIGMALEYRRTLYLLLQTGKSFYKTMIISSVGQFGWLDAPVHYVVAIAVFIVAAGLALVNSDNKEERTFNLWDRLVTFVTVGVLCVFTTISMTNHTIMVTLYGSEFIDATYDIREALYQIPFIGGIQGRYYLPFVVLFFLLLPQIKQMDKKKVRVAFFVFESVLFIYVIFILLNRYWITS